MLSLVLSTVVFFMAAYFIKRYLENMGIPKGMTRGLVVFCLSVLISYSVAWIVDWLAT
jgi:hypothetical protein